MEKKYQCPCCGQFTLESPPGMYDICPICGWEDDPVQFKDSNYTGGANAESLVIVREKYKRSKKIMQ